MKGLRVKLPFLQSLRKLKPPELEVLLAHLDDRSVDILCEAVANVCFNSKLTGRGKRMALKKRLAPHAKALHFAARKKHSLASRKRKLQQAGGSVIAAILGTVVPFLAEQAVKLFKR